MWGIRFMVMVAIVLAGCGTVGMATALAVATVAGVAALVLFAGHPIAAALAMTFVTVLDGHAADSLQSTLAVVTGGFWRYNSIGFVFALLGLAGLPALLRRRDVHTRLWMVLVLVMAAGLAWSPDRLNGAQLVLDVLAFSGMLFVFSRVARDPEVWFWMGLVGGTLAAGASLAYLIAWPRLPFTNPNVSVFVAVTGLVAVCLGLACGARTPVRQYLLMVPAIVNAVCAFLSTSRGGLLAAVVCLAFIAVNVRGPRRAVILTGTVVLGIVVTSFFTPLQQTALQRLSLLFDRSAPVQTRTSGRSDLLIGSWQIFAEHPFGVGTGGFEQAWASLGSVSGQRQFFRAGQRFSAHAGWLRALTENGWIGFLALASFVGSFAWAGIRRGGRTALQLGLLASCGLGLSLVTTEFHLKGLFFLAAGVGAALPLNLEIRPAPAPAMRRPSLVDVGKDVGR